MNWISVKDRLPDERILVEAKFKGLIVWANRWMNAWHYQIKGSRCTNSWILDAFDEIAEWRVLIPPKEDE